jgi:hypothetical protein
VSGDSFLSNCPVCVARSNQGEPIPLQTELHIVTQIRAGEQSARITGVAHGARQVRLRLPENPPRNFRRVARFNRARS